MPNRSSSPTTPATYLPALTGIRAVAAGMVFFFHAAEKAPPSLLQGFVLQWSVGVTIFFVLSGFLITHRYVDQLRLTPAWWRLYLQNRFARIYPIFFLLTLGVFIMYALRVPYAGPDWAQLYTWKVRLFVLVANFTLTRGYFSEVVLSQLSTAWTLTVEETFYLSAPILLLLARRRTVVVLVVWPRWGWAWAWSTCISAGMGLWRRRYLCLSSPISATPPVLLWA